MSFKTFLILAKFLAAHHCENLATTGYIQGDVAQSVAICKELIFDCMIDEGYGSFKFCSQHWRN